MAQPPDERLDPALRRLIAVVLLGGIMGILDGSMITVAADTLARDFNTSLATISWVSTSYLLAITVSIPVTTWAVDRFGGRRLWLAPLGVGSAISMPLSGRLSDRIGSKPLALSGAAVAGLSAFAFTQVDAGTSEAWTALAAFTIGLGLGSVGAPTIASLYRTLPPELVPQGSSVLYMLNQLGASIGIALVALVVQTVGDGDAVRGFQASAWTVTAALVMTLAAATLLPGRPQPATEAASGVEAVETVVAGGDARGESEAVPTGQGQGAGGNR